MGADKKKKEIQTEKLPPATCFYQTGIDAKNCRWELSGKNRKKPRPVQGPSPRITLDLCVHVRGEKERNIQEKRTTQSGEFFLLRKRDIWGRGRAKKKKWGMQATGL